MAVVVSKRVKAALRSTPERVVVLVEVGEADRAAAAAGLVRAPEVFEELPEVVAVRAAEDMGSCSVEWSREVLWLPKGPALVVAVSEALPLNLAAHLADVIGTQVAAEGVQEARVVVPREARTFERCYEEPGAVVFHGFAPPGPVWPPRDEPGPGAEGFWDRFVPVALAWAARAGSQVRATIMTDVCFEVDVEGIAAALHPLVRADLGAGVVLEDRDRGLVWCASVTNHMAEVQVRLGVGGKGASLDDHRTHLGWLTDIARELAPDLAYGAIVLHDTFNAPLRNKLPERPDMPQQQTLIEVIDELVYDAFCYQILGPGHLARLGSPPPGATLLTAGRVELALDPDHWLTDPNGWETSGRAPAPLAARDAGRALLAPCLLAQPDVRKLRHPRRDTPTS